MQYIQFKPMQSILLIEKGNATPTQALNEAIEFVKANNLKEADLDYHGFTFDIEPTSDIREKMADYNYYLPQKTVKATVNGREFNMPCEQAKKVLRLQQMIRGTDKASQ